MKRFWLSLALCLFCVNSLGAVLYAGAPALDDGGGFISLSPFVDCVFWGVLIAVFGAAALFCFLRHRPGPLRVPGRWSSPPPGWPPWPGCRRPSCSWASAGCWIRTAPFTCPSGGMWG